LSVYEKVVQSLIRY